MVREKAPTKRQDNDLYETPHWCIDILAERLERSLPVPEWVVDLGAGDGRIGIRVQNSFRAIVGAIPNLMMVEIAPQEKLHDGHVPDDNYLERDVLDWFDSGAPHECFDCSDNHPERILYVSNPPFSLSHDFVWRTIAYIKSVHAPGSAAAFFLRAGWWIGGGYTDHERVDWFNENLPDAEIGVCPRPSFIKGTSDNSEYAWYVWMHGAHHGTQMEVVLKDRNAKQKKKKGGQECLI